MADPKDLAAQLEAFNAIEAQGQPFYKKQLPMEGRATFLPFRDTMEGSVFNQRELALPGLLAGALNAFSSPERARTGSDPTFNPNEEAMNLAGNVMGGGFATSKGIKNPTGVGGMDLGIVPIDTAKKINMATKLPNDETFLNAVKYTPNAEIVDDGLKISIARNQKPEQSGMESVRGGVFYLPEGSSNAKHYATGVSGYGGKEPISGETIVKNPLFVKGATGGKAPVAAYDSLMGKGAYEKMRGDVLQATRVMSIPESQISNAEKAARIGETLQKYGVDPSLAEYIMQNSKKGNQLPYAMQEYIVGEAARKAGHDSILGFSKKRNGEPFISELFDLREGTYPTQQGGFSLRKEFVDKNQDLTRKELLKQEFDKLDK
jgi:hypothetical protein